MSKPVVQPGPAPVRGDDAADREAVLRILEKHRDARGALIAVLEDIQETFGYLPPSALRTVSDKLGRPLIDVYGVATFYRSFSMTPRGRHQVTACLGTACHVRGAQSVVEEFERQLGIKAGETTPDGEFTLETVNCLGACALGPVVVIDGRCISKVRRARVRKLIEEAAAGAGAEDADGGASRIVLQARCPRCRHALMDGGTGLDGRPSIRVDIVSDRQRGWLRLSSLYGSPRVAVEHDVPEGTVVRFLCPHCGGEMHSGEWPCPACEAPMAELDVEGGMARVCTRRGCRSRMLDLI